MISAFLVLLIHSRFGQALYHLFPTQSCTRCCHTASVSCWAFHREVAQAIFQASDIHVAFLYFVTQLGQELNTLGGLRVNIRSTRWRGAFPNSRKNGRSPVASLFAHGYMHAPLYSGDHTILSPEPYLNLSTCCFFCAWYSVVLESNLQ